jgi:hypothetical protein
VGARQPGTVVVSVVVVDGTVAVADAVEGEEGPGTAVPVDVAVDGPEQVTCIH